jgi:hypothetical protein
MKTLRTVVCLLLAAAVSLVGAEAYACTCAGAPPIEKAYSDATYIFVGRIDRMMESPITKGQREVKVAVQQWFKGKDLLDEEEGQDRSLKRRKDFVIVYTPMKEEECGFNFYQEQDYIIFATGTPARLKTDICTGTVLLDNALPQIKKLGELSGG